MSLKIFDHTDARGLEEGGLPPKTLWQRNFIL
jgi:hypothetical protein